MLLPWTRVSRRITLAVLYTDPDLITKALDLEKRGRGRAAIAAALGVSESTIRKMIVPGWADQERKRQAEFEKARFPIRKNDPDYKAYQALANASDKHRERVRLHKAEREGRMSAAPLGPAAKAARNRVTAEMRRKAEIGATKGAMTLSIEASLAANTLMARRKCTWQALVEQLLIEGAEKA